MVTCKEEGKENAVVIWAMFDKIKDSKTAEDLVILEHE